LFSSGWPEFITCSYIEIYRQNSETISKVNYLIRSAQIPPKLSGDWNNPAWVCADTLEIKNFRPESSDHRPQTFARLLFDSAGIHGIFHVRDRYVRCQRMNYMDEVWKDSCVEFFIQPKSDKGYFNFEFNCGGAFLVCYIVDPTRGPNLFKDFVRIPEKIARETKVQSSLPRIVDPEISESLDWSLQFFIPFTLLEKYVGAIDDTRGQIWRGNFFKCVEQNSHPHWASWSPVDEFNFHLPRCFGTIEFETK
jgi:hypothetical protein